MQSRERIAKATVSKLAAIAGVCPRSRKKKSKKNGAQIGVEGDQTKISHGPTRREVWEQNRKKAMSLISKLKGGYSRKKGRAPEKVRARGSVANQLPEDREQGRKFVVKRKGGPGRRKAWGTDTKMVTPSQGTPL